MAARLSRSSSGRLVTDASMLATTRGAGRPAASAARVMAGTIRSSRTAGPAHVVTVPSASSPAMRSITGPSADSSTDGGRTPGTSTAPAAERVSPRYATVSPRSSGPRTSRYSRTCRAGLSKDIP